MSQEQLYGWMVRIVEKFEGLGYWQVVSLGLLSMGVVVAESCQLTRIAERLGAWGKADSLERRFQRFLANPRLDMQVCSARWVAWVWSAFSSVEHVFLVDETKLSDHIGCMMVGLAYEGRCIPLVWRCYVANSQTAYPAEGQVGMIVDMLKALRRYLPDEATLLIQADRGIGNSSELMRRVQQAGWWFMFRVKQRTVYRAARSEVKRSLGSLVKPGESWSGRGWVFKQDFQFRAYVLVVWRLDQKQPWCLVTNDPTLRAHDYALRMWQEEGFRDLKSAGWRWQTSHVWLPAHADRLLLVLALAYAWVLSQETLLRHQPARLRLIQRGTAQRFSVFRRALRYIRQALVADFPLLFTLRLWPSFPYL
jgi:hypothetical protein